MKSLNLTFTPNFNLIPIVLISFLPIFIIVGSGALNTIIIILDLFFLVTIIKNKDISIFKNKFFYLILGLWFYLLINLFFFSTNFENSLSRSIGFLRFLFFVFALKYFLEIKDNKYYDFIIKIWTIIIFFISFDLFYEFYTGKNTLGFTAELPGRLVGFLKDEMKIGHLYSAFILIALSTTYQFLINKKFNNNIFKDFIFYFVLLFLFIISFLIGERANFIRISLILILFLNIFLKNYKVNLSIIFICFTVFTFITINNERFTQRFWTTFLSPLINNPTKALFTKPYGDHYRAALEVNDRNKLFGVGLRNYANEARRNIYAKNSSVHPHQLYFEFLAELGWVGFFIFLFFFFYSLYLGTISYFKDKNSYKMCAMLFIFSQILPFIPSGSFFTTYGATLFWINYALIVTNKKN